LGAVAEPDTRARKRPALTWVISIVAGALLLWLASTEMELWPERLVLPRPALLALAVALHVPYALVRALRLRYVLDPLVARADSTRTRLAPGLLYGSGLVSFFVVMVLPLRLGELSRPLILARDARPAIGLPESIGAVAAERVVDGLMVVGMLFLGLAMARPVPGSPELTERLEYARWFGQVMAIVFGVGLVGLGIAGAAPRRVAEPARALVGLVSPSLGERTHDAVVRIASAIAPLYVLRQGIPFLAWTVVYWGITVGQLWLVLEACGLDFGLAEAAAIVAIVGLTIQLPGGPAQAGIFQIGMIAALRLFSSSGAIDDAGSSFAALMYLLQLGGGGVLALLGLLMLARARPAGDVSETAAPR
jgi:hypothetical protein